MGVTAEAKSSDVGPGDERLMDTIVPGNIPLMNSASPLPFSFCLFWIRGPLYVPLPLPSHEVIREESEAKWFNDTA